MIVFTTGIHDDRLRMAYNNDVIEFYSDSNAAPLYCDITSADQSFDIRLYPHPNGSFYFNFRPYSTSLLNTRNFVDNMVTNLPDAYVYDFTAGNYLEKQITITIGLDNTTTDAATYSLAWLAGVQQLTGYQTFYKAKQYVLLPFNKLTTNHHYLKYWEGYPFDFSYYSTSASAYINNTTVMQETVFSLPGKISRFVVSDGRTTVTIDDVLPIADGYNYLRVMNGSVENDENDKFIHFWKQPYRCGVYLKWLNQFGGYSYWLFEDTYSQDRSTKQLGELDKDIYNLEDTFTRSMQIGKESQDTIRVIAELLSEDERQIVESIIDSPKIYLFTGEPFSRAGVADWIEIALKTTNVRVKNPKQQLSNFSLDFELPQRYTQTL